MTARGRWWRVAVYALLAAAAVSTIAVIVGQTSVRAAVREVDALLRDADAMIGIGAVARAAELVQEAAEAVRTERNHLRVLDRAYSLSRAEGDWSQLDRLARAAYAAISGSAALQRIAAYAALRVGDPVSALAVVATPRGGETSRALQFLAAEALVAADTPGRLAQGATELTADLADLVTARDTRDPEKLLQLGQRFSEALILDAALLFAGQGALERAASLFESHLADPAYDLAAFLAAYDSGNFAAAERRLSSYRARMGDEALTLQLAADLAVQHRHLADAADVYRRIISLAGDFSWHAYLNLARILSDTGDRLAAFDVLASALSQFSGTPAVTVAMARLYAQAGRSADAELLADRLRQIDAPALELELALLDLDPAKVGAERFNTDLWRLAAENPRHSQLQRVLVARLLSVRDIHGAALALRNFERAAGGGSAAAATAATAMPAWWHELGGVAAALRGQMAAAVAALQLARERDTISWTLPFNLAIALLATGRGDAARVELAEAERRLRVRGTVDAIGPLPTRSASARIHTRIAELQVLEGDLVAARREVNFALELDPAYVRARVLSDRLVDEELN